MPKVLAFSRNRRRSFIYHGGEALHSATVEAGGRAYSRTAPSAALEPLVSVVVPTCGRPQLLNRCVASLALQNYDPERFEIIVVDDRPSDDTRRVVARWAEHTAAGGPKISYIASAGPHGPAAARNHGWRAAHGGIIAFTDDDSIAGPEWLENGLRAFNDRVHAVWGRIVMPLSGTPSDYQLDAIGPESAVFVSANCFCRKRVLEELDGFDERFRYASREDSDLYFRLLSYPANIVHAPKAIVTHPTRPAGWGVSLSQLKKIQFDALLFKKHPALYRQNICAMPRWDYYLTVLALVACIAGLMAGWNQEAAVAGATWVFMTTRFFLKRLMHTSGSPGHVLEMAVMSILTPPMALFWRAVGALKFRVGFL
jgi:glycosyltransferase involved in cell wall biosynthesis